jgi:SAM-dependent methyltransferase
MNYPAVFRYFRRLVRGDPRSWKYLAYELNMFCRGIDLTGASQQCSGISEERSYGYRDSGGPDLDKLLRTLSISSSDTVLDLGCGKAGAMLTLAKYPFARVDGVELSPQLAHIGRLNLQRFRLSHARIFCCDAAEFRDLDLYTYFYLYNPFPETVMRPVLENMVSSLGRRSRKVTVIYKNSLLDHLVVGAGLRKVAETRRTHHRGSIYAPFSIYVWDPVAEPTPPESLVISG